MLCYAQNVCGLKKNKHTEKTWNIMCQLFIIRKYAFGTGVLVVFKLRHFYFSQTHKIILSCGLAGSIV